MFNYNKICSNFILIMNEIDINKLTFNELRNELFKCQNNPVKEMLIRNIMYKRYLIHIQRKKRYKKKRKIKKKLEDKFSF